MMADPQFEDVIEQYEGMGRSQVDPQLENVIEQCGGMGRFQTLLILAMVSCQLTMGWSMLQMSYGSVTPDHYCLTESTPILTNESLNVCSVNGSRCSSYLFQGDDNTVVTEWHLLCDREIIKTTITSVQMSGVLVGTLLAGQLSDLYGRRKTLYSFVLIHIILNFIAAFSSTWIMFAVLRVLIGICIGAILVVVFVYPIEFLPIIWRPILGIIPSWTIGVSIFALLAYLTKSWSQLHITCAVASIPSLFGYFFIPESIRWLAIKGKLTEANDVLIQMARINKKPLPKNTMETLEHIKNFERKAKMMKKKYTYLDLFRGFIMIKRTVICFVFWFSMSVTFYGISFGVGSLFGDLYINIFLLGFFDVPVQTTTFFLNNYVGRKKTTAFFFSIVAVACSGCIVAQMFAPPGLCGPIISGLSLVAKMMVGAAWSCVQVWCSELYPTVTRNLGYGFTSVGARVASIISAYIINLDSAIVQSYSIMVGLSLACTALSFVLDETKGLGLQDSV